MAKEFDQQISDSMITTAAALASMDTRLGAIDEKLDERTRVDGETFRRHDHNIRELGNDVADLERFRSRTKGAVAAVGVLGTVSAAVVGVFTKLKGL